MEAGTVELNTRNHRFSVDLVTEGRRSWLREQSARWNCSEAEALRRAIDLAMEAAEEADQEPSEDRSPRELFARAVRRWFTLELAAEKVGLDWPEVERWLRNKRFLETVQRAQWVFLAEIEHRLLELGRYGKGNALALGEFLKAHHPHYGRAKQEELLRGWARLQDDLLKALAEEFGPQQAEALERAVRRFEQMKEVRLAAKT